MIPRRKNNHWHLCMVLLFVGLVIPWCSWAVDGDQLWEENEGEPIISASGHERFSESVSDGAGGVITVWEDEIDDDPLTMHLKAQRLDHSGNQLWSSSGVWVTNNFRSRHAAVCTDGAEGVIIAFVVVDEYYNTTEIRLQRLNGSGIRQWHPGGILTADVVLTTSPNGSWTPVICQDGAGGAFVGFGPRLSHVDKDGNIDVYTSGYNYIELIPGGTGPFRLIWDGTTNISYVPGTGYVIAPGGCFAAWLLTSGDLKAQWINAGLRWGTNGLTVANHAYYGGFDLVLDDSEDLLLAWMGLDGSTPPVCQVKVQRVNRPGAVQWATGGSTVLDSTTAGGNGWAWYQQKSRPVIAPNGVGGAYIAWTDARDQTYPVTQVETDIYGQLVDENGNPQWDQNGILLPPWLENGVAIGAQWEPMIVSDLGGGAVVAFNDQGICTTNVSAIRLDENGQKLWGHWRGTAYVMWDDWSISGCTTEKDQTLSALIHDGTGSSPVGPIFVYVQSQAAANTDIYAQKVELSNSPPDNDACSDAQEIPPWDILLFGTLARATNDGSTSCGDSSSQPDVWYKYTADQAGLLNVSTCGTHDVEDEDLGMDSIISIHSGCPGTTANEIVCNDDWGDGGCSGTDGGIMRDSAVEANLAKGDTVYIRVSRYNGSLGVNFKLNIDFEAVANDCVADTNGDGKVDGADVGNAADDFGTTTCGATDCLGDVEPDGDVDGIDIHHLVNEYGRIDCLFIP